MRFIVFLALTVGAFTQCGGKVHADLVTADSYPRTVFRPTGPCKAVVEDLRQLAFNDPDAFDLGNLEEQGTVQYMCYTNGKFDKDNARVPSHPWSKLCIQALKLNCK